MWSLSLGRRVPEVLHCVWDLGSHLVGWFIEATRFLGWRLGALRLTAQQQPEYWHMGIHPLAPAGHDAWGGCCALGVFVHSQGTLSLGIHCFQSKQ